MPCDFCTVKAIAHCDTESESVEGIGNQMKLNIPMRQHFINHLQISVPDWVMVLDIRVTQNCSSLSDATFTSIYDPEGMECKALQISSVVPSL